MKCIVRVLTFFAAYVVIGVVSVVVLIGIAVLGAVISQYWQDILLVIVGLLSVASFYAFWIIAVPWAWQRICNANVGDHRIPNPQRVRNTVNLMVGAPHFKSVESVFVQAASR
jgi:hypothetical protein